jgi:hypothetical protein|tara:strand:- start:347 stop:508 length:162 start_codon:yes stop_codon:yes gene_type:complete
MKTEIRGHCINCGEKWMPKKVSSLCCKFCEANTFSMVLNGIKPKYDRTTGEKL